jgi:hypothetical protein
MSDQKFKPTNIFSLDVLVETTKLSVNELYSFYRNDCDSNTIKFCRHFQCGGSVLHTLIKRHFEEFWENEKRA